MWGRCLLLVCAVIISCTAARELCTLLPGAESIGRPGALVVCVDVLPPHVAVNMTIEGAYYWAFFDSGNAIYEPDTQVIYALALNYSSIPCCVQWSFVILDLVQQKMVGGFDVANSSISNLAYDMEGQQLLFMTSNQDIWDGLCLNSISMLDLTSSRVLMQLPSNINFWNNPMSFGLTGRIVFFEAQDNQPGPLFVTIQVDSLAFTTLRLSGDFNQQPQQLWWYPPAAKFYCMLTDAKIAPNATQIYLGVFDETTGVATRFPNAPNISLPAPIVTAVTAFDESTQIGYTFAELDNNDLICTAVSVDNGGQATPSFPVPTFGATFFR